MANKRRRQKGRPWLRTLTNGVSRWYVRINGTLVPVVTKDGRFVDGSGQKAELQALACWQEMLFAESEAVKGDNAELRFVFDQYLQDVKQRASEKTFQRYRENYRSFLARWPGLTARQLKPVHVRQWMDAMPWNQSTQHLGFASLNAALNWAAGADAALISKNPLKGARKPSMRSRGGETLIAVEDFQKLINNVPTTTADLLICLWETGTRPINLIRATARNFDVNSEVLFFCENNVEPGSIVHKTYEKTRETLTIPLTPFAAVIIKKLCLKHPEGPIFRTSTGHPWSSKALASYISARKKTLGLSGFMTYGIRHTRATQLLEDGVEDAKVAAILGQKNTTMIYKHYGHLGSKIKTLTDIVKAVPPPPVNIKYGNS